MNIQKEPLENHHVKLIVEADPADWEKAKKQAARKIAKQVKIPGFRPGRAPYKVVLKHVGEGAIIEEGLEILVDELYPRLLEEAEISPYGPGKLVEISTFDPPVMEFDVPLAPVVELGDYKSIRLPYEPPEVSDDEVEEILEDLRKRNATSESVNRPAEEGDIVYMRVSARRLDIEDEDEAILYSGQFSSARIGEENSAAERQFFPGFSQHLLGVSPEEEKTFTYTYPDDYEDEDLRGAEVEFKVLVTNVQTYQLPELDDEFAKEVSDFETLDALRADIRQALEQNAQQEYQQAYGEEVLQKLIEDSTLHYPPEALEDQKEQVIANLKQRLAQDGLSLESYRQFLGQSDEEFEAQVAEAAENGLQRELVLAEVAQAEKIEPDADTFNRTSTALLQSLISDMTPKQVRDLQKGDLIPRLLSSLAADMTLSRALEYLSTIARGEPWPPEAEEASPQAETADADAEDAAGEEEPAASEEIATNETPTPAAESATEPTTQESEAE